MAASSPVKKAGSFFGSRMERQEAFVAYGFLLPWIIGFLWFTALPMGIAAYVAFTKFSIIDTPEFVGFANFQRLWIDVRLWKALANTGYYAIISVPLYLITAFFAALILNMDIKGVRFYRTIFYLPSVTPAVASAVLWLWIFNSQAGLANQIFKAIGLPPQDWFLDPALSKPAIIFMGLWGIGPTMIIFLAGLQGVPEQLYEAAEIDGAGTWARFWNITVPMMSSVTFFNLILGIIGAFQVFTVAYVLTAGGGGGAGGEQQNIGGVLDSLLFYVLYLWQTAFNFWRMGYASAMGWILLVIILVFTYAQFRFADRWVYYETE